MVLILYAKKNKDTDVDQDRRSKKIVAELQEEEELVIREEEMVEDVEKPSTEPSKTTPSNQQNPRNLRSRLKKKYQRNQIHQSLSPHENKLKVYGHLMRQV